MIIWNGYASSISGERKHLDSKMAERGSNRVDVKNQDLDDMTTCCICSDFYTNPKALPCFHTFCMECLQQTGLKTNIGSGEEMPCPICRQQFKIPPEGFRGLPKNFFIERLIQLANIADQGSPSRAVCKLCLKESNGDANKETPMADTYCVDCKQQLCAECCSEHRKFKLTKNHKLVPITEHEGDQTAMADPVTNVCEQHEKKVLDVYCANCKTVVCAICFIDDHKNHKGSHVDKYFDGFRKEIENQAEAINECISQAQMKRMELLKVKEEMQQSVKIIKCDVAKRKDEIKQLTDDHTNSLLEGLYAIIQSKYKEIQLATDDVDAYVSYLESYNSYCQIIIDKGSASEICSAASGLSARASELQQQCQPITERRIQSLKFCFRKSEIEEILEGGNGNLIGEIEEEGDSRQKIRNRPNAIAEFSKKLDRLRKETEVKTKDNEILQLEGVQLRNKLDQEVQANKALTDELSKKTAKYSEHLETLKQELDNNKIKSNSLRASNGKLKQELDAEKMANISLQSKIDQLKQKLDVEKMTNKSLQLNKDKLKQELDAEKIANNSLKADNDKLLQEVDRLKTTVKTMETNDEELWQKLNTMKTDNKVLEQKQEQERKTWKEEKEELTEQIAELRDKLNPVFVHAVRTKASEEGLKMICGLAILDNELFVATQRSSKVEVYDLMTFSLSRRWNAEGLLRPVDIGSCNKHKCLYIMDCRRIVFRYNEILRVDPDGKLIEKWTTEFEFGYNFCVTNESNIIIPIHDSNKLSEYSPDGQLIRVITLIPDAGNRYLLHALEMGNDSFVVSYRGDPPMVRVTDPYGQGKKLWGQPGSTTKQLDASVHLAVGGNGFVMVAEQVNSRVLILDSDLEFKREILSKDKHGIGQPVKILLDEANGRLYVADNELNNQRILIFDFKMV